MRLTLAVSSLVIVAGVPAQSDGWCPPPAARRNGNNSYAMPGNWGVGRLQTIIDRGDLPPGFAPGKVLTKVAYRRSNYPAVITTTYAAKTINAEVSVGNTPTSGIAISATWANNRPGDLAVVLPLGNVSLPAEPVLGAFNEVGGDIMVFPFAAPRMFTGPNLFIEHVNNTTPGGSTAYWADAFDNRAMFPDGHNSVRGGFGCGAAATNPSTLRAPTALSANPLGGQTTYTLANATASAAFLFTIGVELDRPYGVPAPFDLVPIGASGCPFWNTLDVITVSATTAAGGATTVVTWPADPSIRGLEVGMQALVVSQGFNAAGLTTSNGIDAWIGARHPLTSGQVLENNNLASMNAPANGVFQGAIPITHLFWN